MSLHARDNPRLDRDEVLARLDVTAFFAEHVEGFRRNGRTQTPYRCPLHPDEHPSANLNRETGLWFCQVCGVGGSAIDLAMRLRRLDFREALRYVADFTGSMPAPPREPTKAKRDPLLDRPADLERMLDAWSAALWNNPERLDYLRKERLLSDSIIREFRLGWDGARRWDLKRPPGATHPGGAFVIPLWDARDPERRVRGVKFYRAGLDPKMNSLTGTPASEILYGRLPETPGARVWGTEGEFDALALVSIGEAAVTSCAGAKLRRGIAWPKEWGKALAPFKVIAAGDADLAGFNYSADLADVVQAAGGKARVLAWPATSKQGFDVTDALKAGGIEGLLALVKDAAPAVVSSEPEAPDEGEPLPEIPVECWRPGFDVWGLAYTRTTEASDAYLWGGYAMLGALSLGRQARLALGFDLFANLYIANTGASGRARKTTSQAYVSRTLPRVAPHVIVSRGIGSPEGLLELLKDGPARVLVDLNELSTLLRKGAQEATRGLPPLLTTLYDAPPSVRLPNRSKDLEAVEPFLCLYGSTTTEWLRKDLSVDDVKGGLAGRICYLVGKEKPPIPWPPPPDGRALAEAERILTAASERHRCAREYDLSADARAYWSEWYVAERARAYRSPILEALAQRLHTTAWKTSLLFAALEGTDSITKEQIAAGCAFADYQRAAQAAVFEGLGESERAKTERRVIEALRRHGDLAGWRLRQIVRRVTADDLARTLQNLARLGVIQERGQGRGAVWHLVGGQN